MTPHLPAPNDGGMDPAPTRYTIRIHGHLGATVLSAFPALVPLWHGADTVLTGLLDRSALYGVLAEIEALGLDLVEVRQLTRHQKSPRSGDSRVSVCGELRAAAVLAHAALRTSGCWPGAWRRCCGRVC